MADRTETDFPQGDGNLDCPICKGRGVVTIPDAELPQFALPGATRFCECVRKRDLLDNLKRAWPPLLSVMSVPSSPLLGRHRKNVWLRCSLPDLKQHLRCVAVKQSPHWRFKVITDTDLMTTWLYSADEVHDADVDRARVRAENTQSRITDLVEPWDLLIIRLGVKAARNSATAEVFLEGLLHREQLGLPTWVVDSPGWPLRQGHLAWDERVQEFMGEFEFIEIGASAAPGPPVASSRPAFTVTGFGEEPEAEEGEADVLDETGRVKPIKRDWRKS